MNKRAVIAIALSLAIVAMAFATYEQYSPQFDADYVGASVCGDCHTQIYPEWQRSPHANMVREATPESVVGDFSDTSWALPRAATQAGSSGEPAARMARQGDKYYMALLSPEQDAYVAFPIEYVVGYQYRQVYLTREANGVLRRLPLQWSVKRQEFFPYWNLQEQSTPSVPDLWAQMQSMNSAWNLFCARCHTTNLLIHDKDAAHTRAKTEWLDNGIACEACHGPGSLHVRYFGGNYVNRFVNWIDDKFRDQPAAYMANAKKLDKQRAMSVCARCHGADILMANTDIYRIYEPGFSREGRINDLSPWFQQTPLVPNRDVFTLETYADGEPKGIGMLFRSLIESECYQQAEVRCFDCHNPHDNKQPAVPGILAATDASNNYCLGSHRELGQQIAEHTRHKTGTAGSFCYDCHMPKIITKLATGVWETTRTHRMSFIPAMEEPSNLALNNTPGPCQDCHQNHTAWQ